MCIRDRSFGSQISDFWTKSIVLSLGGLQMASNDLMSSHLGPWLLSPMSANIRPYLVKSQKFETRKSVVLSLGGLQMATNDLMSSDLGPWILSPMSVNIRPFLTKKSEIWDPKISCAVTRWPPDGLQWPHVLTFRPLTIVPNVHEHQTIFSQKVRNLRPKNQLCCH